MARIAPLLEGHPDITAESGAAIAEIRAADGRVTNMKRTLARSPSRTARAHDLVRPARRDRSLSRRSVDDVFAHAISAGTDCLVCSTFFRRLLIDAGEDPERLRLGEWEQTIVDFGRQLAVDPHGVSDELFGRLAARLKPEQIVALTAFGGLMVATNLFNNALRVDLDEYLYAYRKEGMG